MARCLHRAGLRPRRDRRGIAAVELALVAPFLCFILMACIDFGRAISQNIQLSHAVRAGVQYAVTAANAQTRIEGAVRDALPEHLKAATIITACYCGVLPSGDTGLPPAARCDSACPAGSARMMTLQAESNFRPYTFAAGPTVAKALRINKVSANATIRHQ